MDRILILDRDPDHADALSALFRRAGRSVEASTDERIAIANADGIDVLVVVPPERPFWKEQVREICRALNTGPNRPAVLCVLRWPPQGAADRLFADSVGVEVQHEY